MNNLVLHLNLITDSFFFMRLLIHHFNFDFPVAVSLAGIKNCPDEANARERHEYKYRQAKCPQNIF
jgi:hypothetical protein